MTTQVSLGAGQREQIALGRFVRVQGESGAPAPATPSSFRGTFLVGLVAGEWRAYVNECRHRALPLDLGASSPMSEDGQHLLCHQHGALYRLEDGSCVLGPCAGERLTPVAVRAVTKDGRTLLFLDPHEECTTAAPSR
jgi:nitrite reductase/ring-hydroxylating ferredoxin subunit